MSYGRRRRRYNRFWSSGKTKEAIYEAKNFGLDYLRQKYGNERVSQIVSKIEAATKAPGRGKTPSGYTNEGGKGGGSIRYVKGRGMVRVGNSGYNRPRTVDGSKYKTQAGTAVGGRFRDGGPTPPPPPSPNPDAFPPGNFKPRMKLNLENDEELAQGSQHEWAQPTSISSTITGLLRQSQNASSNFWDQWSQDKGGQIALDSRGSSPWGVDMRWTDKAPTAPALQAAMQNPMGAFGTNSVFGGFPAQQETQWVGANGDTYGWHTHNGVTEFHADPARPGYMPAEPTTPTTPTTTPPSPNDPDLPPVSTNNNPLPPHANTPLPPNANPWAYGVGGEANAYGPNSTSMANSTLEAMSLANAYFAPQRMELAYELGDMETDMRRLAVNLGRQVDDPVLQAKLYKEAMRSVRTLDVQQNTFAFQMAEQRRREELQNYQFYDQLAQEEYRLRMQNMQFYEQLDLQNQYFNLERYKTAHPPTTTTNTTTSTGPTTPAAPGQLPGMNAPLPNYSMIQNQFPTQPSPTSTMNLGGSLLGLNPYASSSGGANVARFRKPY